MGQAEVLEILKENKNQKLSVNEIHKIFCEKFGNIDDKNMSTLLRKLFTHRIIKREGIFSRIFYFVYWYEE